jgi:hypothetical protein
MSFTRGTIIGKLQEDEDFSLKTINCLFDLSFHLLHLNPRYPQILTTA